MDKMEYLLFLALLVVAGLGFPAFRDVLLLQSVVLSLCAGLI